MVIRFEELSSDGDCLVKKDGGTVGAIYSGREGAHSPIFVSGEGRTCILNFSEVKQIWRKMRDIVHPKHKSEESQEQVGKRKKIKGGKP